MRSPILIFPDSAAGPPESVILKKLEYFREGESPKHVWDIQNILRLVDVDRAFIEAHVERLGLRDQWLACQPGAK